MPNFITLLIIIITLLPSNAFHSDYNDSLTAHNFLGGPSSSGGARSASGGAPPAPPLATGLMQPRPGEVLTRWQQAVLKLP